MCGGDGLVRRASDGCSPFDGGNAHPVVMWVLGVLVVIAARAVVSVGVARSVVRLRRWGCVLARSGVRLRRGVVLVRSGGRLRHLFLYFSYARASRRDARAFRKILTRVCPVDASGYRS
jgi:hypothetical protein